VFHEEKDKRRTLPANSNKSVNCPFLTNTINACVSAKWVTMLHGQADTLETIVVADHSSDAKQLAAS
jgi:hypothetical protein